MKKISVFVAIILIISFVCPCVSADYSVTIYAPDGRSAVIAAFDVDLYRSVGWYTEPVCTVYALDGRSAVIYTRELDAYTSVGWYTAPVTLMYSVDGRSIVVYTSQVNSYSSVGWYTAPVTVMYNSFGDSIVVYRTEVEAYKRVGWYTTPQPVKLPITVPLELTFSSGAGGWLTGITLYADGSFDGCHSDSDMGVTGPGYPHGTRYICNFRGKFSNITKINDYSYSMKLTSLSSSVPQGRVWIQDKVKFISSYPYGIDDGSVFIFYTPDAPLSAMNDEFLSWWPGRFSSYNTNNYYGLLSYYGLYNVSTGEGFFGDYR